MIKDQSILTPGRIVFCVHYNRSISRCVIVGIKDDMILVFDLEDKNNDCRPTRCHPEDLYLHKRDASLAVIKMYQEEAAKANAAAASLIKEMQS